MMAASIGDARSGNSDTNGDSGRAAGFVDQIVAYIGEEEHELINMADEMIIGPDCRELCARYDYEPTQAAYRERRRATVDFNQVRI